MSAPAVLVILIAASELSSPATVGLLHAARETLGASTTLRLQTLAITADAPELPRPENDQAYVSIAWQGSRHDSARILAHLPGSDQETERVLSFGPADPEEERGRSVGFVIASLFAGAEEASAPKPVQSHEAPQVHAPLSPPLSTPRRYALSLEAVAAYPKSANSFGAYFDATREFGADFGLGLYADARFGSIQSAQASTRWLSIGAVGRLRVLSISTRSKLTSVIRIGVRQLSVTHLSEDDIEPDQRIVYLPLGSLALRLSVDLAQAAAIYAHAGVEAQAGEVMVNVRGGTAATIPFVFGTCGVGVMARF